MRAVIYWFRNDLRLADNPAFAHACRSGATAGATILPVYCHDPEHDSVTSWGFARVGIHRQRVLAATLADLSAQLATCGSGLLELAGKPHAVLPALAQSIGADTIACEAIEAPEEQAEVAALRAAGMTVATTWQSSLLDPAGLPFAMTRLPDVFTAFRQAVENAGVLPSSPLPVPAAMPALPECVSMLENRWKKSPQSPQSPPSLLLSMPVPAADNRSSFPYHTPAFAGGERAAMAHLDRYFARKLAHTYKATRNGLAGTDYSSKFSPWLASGALSARTAYAALKRFEAEHGASDGSYWLWFELLWRDYFRFLHLKYGRRLYRAHGLAEAAAGSAADSAAAPTHDNAAFGRWCRGATGEPLVDAGMRELAATGYLSNRLRQVVASYLIHDLGGDWRAGAAWFEAQLVDYDVYSNQGNWLYLAGYGTDPRSGRRFNPHKQARDYDADGHYQSLWL